MRKRLCAICIPYKAVQSVEGRQVLTRLIGPHMVHGSLRFTSIGVLVTSEMVEDYPEFDDFLRRAPAKRITPLEYSILRSHDSILFDKLN